MCFYLCIFFLSTWLPLKLSWNLCKILLVHFFAAIYWNNVVLLFKVIFDFMFELKIGPFSANAWNKYKQKELFWYLYCVQIVIILIVGHSVQCYLTFGSVVRTWFWCLGLFDCWFLSGTLSNNLYRQIFLEF